MRLRLPFLVLATATVLAAGSGTAHAITNGEPDGSAHPEVGALINDTQYADGTWAYCTGTLVSPTVFVTAAHCGEPGQTTATVSFSSAYKAGDKTYVGRYVADERYSGVQSDPHDLAVVVFPKPIKGITPASLPPRGLLDRLQADGTLKTAAFTSVGYGAYEVTSGGRDFFYDDVRMRAQGSFDSLQTAWLRLSMNANTGDGGTCYGDSGGPNFLGGNDSHLLVSTTITGDAVCRATNVTYRLDSDSARSFLRHFVALP